MEHVDAPAPAPAEADTEVEGARPSSHFEAAQEAWTSEARASAPDTPGTKKKKWIGWSKDSADSSTKNKGKRTSAKRASVWRFTTKELTNTFDEAKAKTNKLRFRVSGMFLAVGALLWIPTTFYIFVDVGMNVATQGTPPSAAPNSMITNSLIPPGVSLIAMALVPTDSRMIFFLIGIFHYFIALFGALFGACGVIFAAMGDQARWSAIPNPAAAAIWCFGYSLICFTTSFNLFKLMQPAANSPRRFSKGYWAIVKEQQQQYREEVGEWHFKLAYYTAGILPVFWLGRAHYFKITSAYSALNKWWRDFRLFWLAGIPVNIITIIVLVASQPDDDSYESIVGLSLLTFTAALVAGSVGRVRQKMRRFLIYLATPHSEDAEGSEGSAAAIAALVSSTGRPKQALEEARKRFRVLDVENLYDSDLSTGGNTDLASKAGLDLRARTRPEELGKCDVFFSHSWRDEDTAPGAKFYQLMAWAADFYEKELKKPCLWLDKACIAQDDIDSELACLPVFLAGCRVLFICAGPTYTGRLWCVMELFTFLSMGGTSSRVHLRPVLPLDSDTEETTKALKALTQKFADFQAYKAECFKVEDRQHLLGIIETGFGDFRSFDKLVRKTFSTKIGLGDAEAVLTRNLSRIQRHFPKAYKAKQMIMPGRTSSRRSRDFMAAWSDEFDKGPKSGGSKPPKKKASLNFTFFGETIAKSLSPRSSPSRDIEVNFSDEGNMPSGAAADGSPEGGSPTAAPPSPIASMEEGRSDSSQV